MELTNKDGITVVLDIADVIIKNREFLSEVDGAIGDGDHGINMAKGFNIAKDEISGQDLNMSEGFKVVSNVLMNKIGGSMGPLYGSFFRGLFIASRKSEIIDKIVILSMLEKAYSNIAMISDAKVNDKTLIDVLDPSIKSYKEAVENDEDLISALEKMMLAANEGVEATKSMVANIGRAARLGERSIGHQDAGATSCALILNAFGSSVIRLIKE